MTLKRLYVRWIWANAWSELIGLGGTMVIGFALFSRFQDGNVVVLLAGIFFAVVAGAALEGGLVGYAQARVLRGAVARLRMRQWVTATVVGAGMAWFLGMIPSTAMALTSPPLTEPVEGPSGWFAVALAAGLGFVLGPVLSTPQAVVFRRIGIRGWSWIPANAMAWAFGMVIMFGAAGAVPQEAGLGLVMVIMVVGCLLTGTVVGVIHGAWLLRILAQSVE